MKTKIALPSIHLNGSGRIALIEQNHKAYMAVHEAIVAMREATPHDRDYYVQGPDVGPQARREHMARLEALEKVRDDLGQIWQSALPEAL